MADERSRILPPLIRPATVADLSATAALYGHHVENGTGTFEENAPDLSEMTARYAAISATGLPYLVACAPDGAILGFAYANLYRPRVGYRFTVEDSIYVAPTAHRRGIGTALLHRIIERSTALGYRQMIGVVGDSENLGSIRLHKALGFVEAGRIESVGFKFGRWIDVVILQRPLGDGDTTLPGQ